MSYRLILESAFPGANFSEYSILKASGIVLPKEKLVEVARHLRDAEGFVMLVDVLGIDRATRMGRFEVVYNLFNIEKSKRLFLKVIVEERDASVPSLSSVWESANWYEREAYDMFGITFTGHPDLRRMYMPEDFQYFPLRKEFPVMGIEGSLPLPNNK